MWWVEVGFATLMLPGCLWTWWLSWPPALCLLPHFGWDFTWERNYVSFIFIWCSSQQNAFLNYNPWVVHKEDIDNLFFLCTLGEPYVLVFCISLDSLDASHRLSLFYHLCIKTGDTPLRNQSVTFKTLALREDLFSYSHSVPCLWVELKC